MSGNDDDNLPEKRPSVYWSVIHHKDIEDTGPARSCSSRSGEVEHLLQGSSKSEASYGSSMPPTQQTNDPQIISPGWERIREMVQTKEILIHHIPDLENSDSDPKVHKSTFSKWSDLHEYQYEYTLRECFFLMLILLAIGVIGFSILVEAWSVIDSCYFTLVLLCTIGYGDMTPSKAAGKIFASLFALGGIVILGLALGVVGSQLVEAEIHAAEKAREKTSKSIERAFTKKISMRSDSSTSLSSLPNSDSATAHNGEKNDFLEAIQLVQESEGSYVNKIMSSAKKTGKKCWKVICMFSKYLVCVAPIFAGAFLIAYVEGWQFVDTLYFTVVTATTIGLGDLTPTTQLSKVCAIFFIPIAVSAMGYVLGQCASYLVEMRREERHRKLRACDLKLEDIYAMDEDHDGGVTEVEYIKYMLVAMKKVDASLFDELHDQFKQLDLTNTGLITKKDLQLIAERRLKKASYKLQLSDYKHKLRTQSEQSVIHSSLRRLSVAKRKSIRAT